MGEYIIIQTSFLVIIFPDSISDQLIPSLRTCTNQIILQSLIKNIIKK